MIERSTKKVINEVIVKNNGFASNNLKSKI